MAEILTRTYTYTGQSDWAAGNSSVPLSAFAVSGDMRPITQILSIKASFCRLQDTSSTVSHTAELAFANGSDTLVSNTVSKRQDKAVWRPEVVFSTMPSAADWTAENVTFITRINTKYNHVFWMATDAQPMVITITFTSSEFKPSMHNVVLYRANDFGAAANIGQYITFSAGLKLEKTGANGSGTLEIYENTTKNATTEGNLIYYQTGIAVSTAITTIIQTPIPGYTLAIGDKRYFYMRFSYTAETESGVAATESIAVKFYIGNTFTNVHLAKASTGGVAFGKFSSSTEGDPLFECEYTAIFNGRVVFNGKIEGLLDFSLTETPTGGAWIDGKPIYRCVIEVGAKTANTMTLDVSSLIIERFVDLRGMFYAQADYASGYTFPAPAATADADYCIQLEAQDRSTIRIVTNKRTWNSGYIILEYTKITEDEEETPGTGDIPQQSAGSDSSGNVTITANDFSMTDDGSGALEITSYAGYTVQDDGDGNITFTN